MHTRKVAEKQIWTVASPANVEEQYTYKIHKSLLQNKRITCIFPNTPKSKAFWKETQIK